MAERSPVVKPKPDRRRHPRVPVQKSPYDHAFERARPEAPARRGRSAGAEAEPDDDREASALFEHAVC